MKQLKPLKTYLTLADQSTKANAHYSANERLLQSLIFQPRMQLNDRKIIIDGYERVFSMI